MASFWDQGPNQDFNLGGFHLAPPDAPVDPRLTTQPQPSQQGPGGTISNGQVTSGPSLQDLAQMKVDALQKQYPQGGMFGNLIHAVTSPQFQQVAQQMGTPQGRMAAMLQAHPAGGLFGNIAHAVTSPAFQQIAQQRGNPNVAQAIGGVAGSLQGPMSTMGQYFQNNTPTPTSQPMNPSQQSQVPMQSPDGQHFQYVNAEHVPHYQGLGATIANGSSYGSQSGGF